MAIRFEKSNRVAWQRGAPVVVAVAAFAFVLWRLVRADRPAPAVASGPETAERRASLPPRLRSIRELASATAHRNVPAGRPVTGLVQPPPSSEGPGPHLLRYGGRSGALPPTTLARADSVVQVSSLAKQPELAVWLPRLRVSPAGTPIFARLRAPGGVLRELVVELATGPGVAEPTRFVPMESTRAGEEPEFRARYEAPAAAPAGTGVHTPPPAAVRYLVRARGQLDGQPFSRTAGGIFYLHRPGGRLQTARTQVVRREGDLLVQTAALIERPGTYWAYAELWGGADGDRPIAFARERLASLRRGRHAFTLRFGGLIVRDSGVDGPYRVRNLQLKQVDTHPPHEGEPESLPATPAWRASDF
jgi:hypothetical protein